MTQNAQVRGILNVLASKIEGSVHVMNGQEMSMSLYGLCGMNSKEPEVRRIVRSITTKIADSRFLLNGQGIGNALYGLNLMSRYELSLALI